jgi:SAM-dependent methyltransferase
METQSIFNKNRVFYEEFLANTDQKKNSSDFLIKQIDLIKKPINILSVGAGAGDDVAGLLRYLGTHNIQFKFFYLDPSQYSFGLFKKRLAELKLADHLSGVAIGDLEIFENEEKFDLIIASHVFYYIRDWDKSLLKLHNLLSDNGKLLIFMQSKGSDNFKFRNKFIKKILDKDYNEKSGEELIKVIKKIKLGYEMQKVTSKSDVTSVFPNGGLASEGGAKVLSFLLRADYNDLDKKLQSRIKNYLSKNAKSENDKKIFKLVDNYIVIKK